MRGNNQIGQARAEQRVAVARRLFGEHIKACAAQLPIFQRRHQRLLVYQAAAAAVDQYRAGFHLPQFGLAYHIGSGLGERAMQRNHVGAFNGFGKSHIALAHFFCVFVFAKHHPHAEGLRIAGERVADAAAPENHQRFAA